MYISLLELLLEIYIYTFNNIAALNYVCNYFYNGREIIQLNRKYYVNKCIILDDDYELNIVPLFP